MEIWGLINNLAEQDARKCTATLINFIMKCCCSGIKFSP